MGLAGEPENVCCGAMIKYWCVAQGTVAGFIQYETPLKSWDHACGVLCVIESGGKASDAGGGGFCADVAAKAKRRGLRCEVDPGKDRLNKQIRNAEQQRVPLMCVVGEQETSSGRLSVRARGRGDLGKIDVDALFTMLQDVDEMDQLDEGAFEKAPEPEPQEA